MSTMEQEETEKDQVVIIHIPSPQKKTSEETQAQGSLVVEVLLHWSVMLFVLAVAIVYNYVVAIIHQVDNNKDIKQNRT